jgi:phosphohistidine phosphatase
MLYLVQHAEATAKAQNPDRPLTERGATNGRQLGAFLARAGVPVDSIYHSGKLRAQQTADILSEHLTPGLAPEPLAGLAATDPVGPVTARIGEWDGSVMLVSHLPLVGGLAGALVAGAEDRPPVAFHPGTVVALERNGEAGWQVAWMVRPELLR